MLYLIQNHKGYLKIGHSKEIGYRMNSYINHGAEIELIDTCEGTTRLERRLQTILYNKGLWLFSEWYKNDWLVYKLWYMAKMKKWKPLYYKEKKTNKILPYDLYLNTPQEVREHYDSEEPKFYKGHLKHHSLIYG